MRNLIIGFAFSILIAIAAYKKRSLSRSGALAAALLGGLMYYFGGVLAAVLLVGFFISSSLLTFAKGDRKKDIEKYNEKGGRRDALQVFANGGVGLLFAALYYFTKNPAYIIGCAVSFGEANADTWASEIGVLSKKTPISILTGKRMERGMSGGVSFLGTLAALGGSAFIALLFSLVYILIYGFDGKVLYRFIIILLFGFLGAVIDSVLGASIQAQYYCQEENTITEKKEFRGKPNKLIKGFALFNNDVVNISSNILSSMMVFLII
ncbi:DUF92 domain-containing protein [Clostridium polynesiense]|uniref:DUF92 domain-containing protein n=1 Tax=Clostridium polynesiense TaxID=1325933 RepID=UPI00058B0E6C|nr:DUF92 domain-containing protein [Clostridium polynesiense]